MNLHATSVVLGTRGVLITGPSGAGKSSLALETMRQCRAGGRFARLVADDQVFVTHIHGRLLASAPEPIAGLIEIRGYGPVDTPHEPAAVIDLIVRLVASDEAPRIRDDRAKTLEGVALPCLTLAERQPAAGARAVMAALGMHP